eukprot:TRINITY_DN4307_c0_g1_i3.p1 TRINITY_DN4307_c0_g1~~TRINITY_DN4307_c0_g1_i3.p1  ORF type:complete len:986 (+),score=123.66 TRINITY_DN4307_c0_g1_i3:230-2959(+)
MYGSNDGFHNTSDYEFHRELLLNSEKLHIKPHRIVQEGAEHTIASHLDIKGMRGTDGRMYLLDIIRSTPHDLNFSPDTLALLRPEFLTEYLCNLRAKKRMQLRQLQKQQQVRKQRDNSAPEPIREDDIEKILGLVSVQCNLDSVIGLGMSTTVPTMVDGISSRSTIKLAGGKRENKEDLDLTKDLSDHLKKVVIVELVRDMLNGKITPTEGCTLSFLMHKRGVNMRYLGHITKLISVHQTRSPIKNILLMLCYREMVIRSCKKIFNKHLREAKATEIASVLATLLNSFFQESLNGNVPPNQTKQGTNVTPSNSGSLKGNGVRIWESIRKKILDSFDYKFPKPTPPPIFCLSTLRGICTKVGISLEAREYDLTAPDPFRLEDFVLYPVVKHVCPTTEDGTMLLNASKRLLVEGKLDMAFEVLTEALAVFYQVYGPMKKETGEAHSLLARIYSDLGDYNEAISHQKKALIILERVLGIVHSETAYAYNNLALYIHLLNPKPSPMKSRSVNVHTEDPPHSINAVPGQVSPPGVPTTSRKLNFTDPKIDPLPKPINHRGVPRAVSEESPASQAKASFSSKIHKGTHEALKFAFHALHLFHLLDVSSSLALANTHYNVGVILQDLNHILQSRTYFFKSLEIFTAVLPKDDLQISDVYHALALSFYLTEEFEEAVSMEEKALNIYRVTIGIDNLTYMQSNIWLGQFNQAAQKQKGDGPDLGDDLKSSFSWKHRVPQPSERLEGILRATETQLYTTRPLTGQVGDFRSELCDPQADNSQTCDPQTQSSQTCDPQTQSSQTRDPHIESSQTCNTQTRDPLGSNDHDLLDEESDFGDEALSTRASSLPLAQILNLVSEPSKRKNVHRHTAILPRTTNTTGMVTTQFDWVKKPLPLSSSSKSTLKTNAVVSDLPELLDI